MTPMMFPPGAAGAAPGGPATIADALTGAPAGAPAGAATPEDDGGFAAFEVALLAILETATLTDGGVQVDPDLAGGDGSGSVDSGGGAGAALPDLWLQSLGRRSDDGEQAETEGAGVDPVATDADDELDEVALASAALTLVTPVPP
ncbi:MAG: hypothetical protein ABL986_09860, partial [Vicinamibacterales bacterium]